MMNYREDHFSELKRGRYIFLSTSEHYANKWKIVLLTATLIMRNGLFLLVNIMV